MRGYRLCEPDLRILNHQSNHDGRNNSAYSIKQEIRDDCEGCHGCEEQEDERDHEGEGAVRLAGTPDEDAIQIGVAITAVAHHATGEAQSGDRERKGPSQKIDCANRGESEERDHINGLLRLR